MTGHPVWFLVACVALLPTVVAAAEALTVLWFERVYLPQIAGAE